MRVTVLNRMQKGFVGQQLAPFEIKVEEEIEGEFVASYKVPVEFILRAGKGDLEATSETDSNGIAIAILTPRKAGQVQVICKIICRGGAPQFQVFDATVIGDTATGEQPVASLAAAMDEAANAEPTAEPAASDPQAAEQAAPTDPPAAPEPSSALAEPSFMEPPTGPDERPKVSEPEPPPAAPAPSDPPAAPVEPPAAPAPAEPEPSVIVDPALLASSTVAAATTEANEPSADQREPDRHSEPAEPRNTLPDPLVVGRMPTLDPLPADLPHGADSPTRIAKKPAVGKNKLGIYILAAVVLLLILLATIAAISALSRHQPQPAAVIPTAAPAPQTVDCSGLTPEIKGDRYIYRNCVKR